MTISANLKRDNFIPFYGSKEGNDISVMLDCKAVVEKKDFVSTGILTYAHGEIIEVEIPQYDVFRLGDPVKLMVYSKNGIFVFESTVIAKSNGALIMLNPPSNRKKFVEKREHPRIELSGQGLLKEYQDNPKRNHNKLENPIPILINNISLSGTGFTLDYDLSLKPGIELILQVDLGFTLNCTAEVIRSSKSGTGFYYGTRFLDIPVESSNSLRAYILKRQVEAYYKEKREKLMAEMNLERAAVNS